MDAGCGGKIDPYPTAILAATVLGAGLGFMGASIVNVALPTFQTELGADATDIQWIVSAYNLAIAALLLSAGAFSDRHGHLKIFRLGLLICVGASIVCAVAWSPFVLIIGRALQGFASALLVPSSLGLVNTVFPAHNRGYAVGLWSSFSAVGGGLGPIFGGLAIEFASWQMMFLINLPIVGVVWWLLRGQTNANVPPHPQRRFDWLGSIYSIVALGLLTFAAIESPRIGVTHPVTIGLFIVACVAGLLFLRTQQRSDAPLMPLTMFHSRNFAAANVVTFLTYCTIGGGFYVMMLTWIQIQGYSPLAAGAITLPFMLFTGGFAHTVSSLVRRIGPKLPLSSGALLLGVGFFTYALPAVGTSFWIGYLPGVLLTALGIALLVAPITTVVMGSVTLQQSGTASGINSAIARSAILLSVAVLGAVHFAQFEQMASMNLDQLSLDPALETRMRAELTKMGAAEIPGDTSPAIAAALKAVITESFMSATRFVLMIAGGLSILAAIIAFVSIDRPRRESLLDSGDEQS